MKSPENVPTDIPVMRFKRPGDWAAWLDKHHATSSGVWLMLAKKAAGITSVSYDEALEVALCYAARRKATTNRRGCKSLRRAEQKASGQKPIGRKRNN